MLIKIYTIAYVLLYLYITFTPSNLKLCGIWEWIDIVFMLFGIAGMVSLAFGFRFFIRKFWEYFFYLFTIYELAYMTWLQLPFLERLGCAKDQIVLTDVINVIFLIPLGLSLYQLQKHWERSPYGVEKRL
jgi:hypothetical protein